MLDHKMDLLNPTIYELLKNFQLDKVYVKGEGSYLWDDDNNRYLDFIAQYGAVPFGYNPKFIWDAITEVRDKGLPSMVQPSLPPIALNLANRLMEITPGDLCYTTFTQSGAEAVEAAVKLARSSTKKPVIISTINSFHGKTLGALSATGREVYQTPFGAPVNGFIQIPFNDINALEDVLVKMGDKVAAFIVEPIQGEGGMLTATKGYLKAVQELCRKHNVLFILDEIQTGLGRTGTLFASDFEEVEPDILLLAKALGGGILPLGVCISSSQVWNDEFGSLHSSTFANNNVTSAAGLAVIEELTKDNQALINEISKKGDYLFNKVVNLKENYPEIIREVRGRGLMIGIEFNDFDDCGSYDMTYLTDKGGFTALLAGFLLNVYNIRIVPFLNNPMTLRLEPVLTISYEEIDYVLDALETVCKIIEKQDFAQLYKYLVGDYSKPNEIVNYRLKGNKIKSSQLMEGEKPSKKFAFIIHYPAPEDVVLNNPSFERFSRQQLYEFMKWQSNTTEPGIVCHMPAIKSLDGTVVEGWLIGVPFGGREIMELPNNEVVDVIAKAVDIGRDLGADIVGLGALTSVVTRGGRAVQGRGVAITSGNSYTTLIAMDALYAGAQKMKIELDNAQGAVLGATGSIGRACALMLSDQVINMSLLGNPKHPTSSKNRLSSLAQEIFERGKRRYQKQNYSGISLWLNNLVVILSNKNKQKADDLLIRINDNKEELELDYIKSLCKYVNIDFPIKMSVDIANELAKSDMIVAASNSPDYLVYPEHLKSGAVVCDVARPADVSPRVYEERNDVLILEGGLVSYPDKIAFGPNLGYREGVSLACLSETVLLALEGDKKDYSIGMKLSLETVDYLRFLAQKHGFGLAGLRMGNEEIDDKKIEKIYQNSLNLDQVDNL
ncbi:PLP-dependent aminotransferase / Domain of unknown function [Candidatus Syntrophocurvum alkaliphilum]|uniref:Acetylornithine aminotransferase n=1 Tax=Candidatus Syntrophocurvum alkaliphilum TaxID=2293317 RepID=A0A6I6DBM8_9FIRM|nr:aminotransferase class III-fold pyridoxal phosphate-dependent enzyme [Candidatus Syntrophocurvum alkaliphilum]QGT98864.1 PLP-dependent aminotransferase / Domain of unknown function [Candidatus Syntrophocurvum alkaliphilum]